MELELVFIFGVAPVYVIGAACLWYTERWLVGAALWPIVAVYRTFGG